MMEFRALAVGAALALAAAAALAQREPVQNYPSKPIRLIVPFAPGGGTDITARTIGQKLAEAWGQPVVIDNRSGAAGNIGMELAAKSPPDGYTLTLVSATHSVNPSLKSNLPYDLVRDLTPVTRATSQPYILVVHPAVPARSVAELLALARAKPGSLSYGSSGTGGFSHLSGALLASMTKTNLVHVPYKGGSPALSDVIAGQIQMVFATPLESGSQIRAGRVRTLAVSTTRRSIAFPEIPTLNEAGVPGFEVNGWYGILAPAKTPREIIAKLNAEITRILRTPEVVEHFARNGVEAVATTPEEFGAHIRAEIAKWKKVVAEAGLKAE